MKSRLNRYHGNDNQKQNISRLAKNKHLYDDLNNKIGFEELVDFNTQTRIELTSLSNTKKNRESYHQLKDYQDLISSNQKEQNIPMEKEEEKIFDINSILEEARKNRTDSDELEKKRKLKDEEYNILSDLNKKYLSKDKDDKKDEYEGLEELINTITSKTLVHDIKIEEEKQEADLLSDLIATSVDLQVKSPEEYENEGDSEIAKKIQNEQPLEEKEIDDSFYTRSMDLSEHDFYFDESDEGKTSVKKVILITLIVVILLTIIAVVTFFVLQHFGIDLNISEWFK